MSVQSQPTTASADKQRDADREADCRIGSSASLQGRVLRRLRQRIDMMGTVLGITVTAIVGFVGLTAMQTTSNATNLSGTQFAPAHESLISSINTAYSLLEVAFIVAILALVIAALVGLRMRRPQ
jgi:hypothetical protein